MRKVAVLIILMLAIGVWVWRKYFNATPGIETHVSIGQTEFELLDYRICLYCLPHRFTAADYLVAINDTVQEDMTTFLSIIDLPPRTGYHPNVYFVHSGLSNDEVMEDFRTSIDDFRSNESIVAIGEVNEYTDEVKVRRLE